MPPPRISSAVASAFRRRCGSLSSFSTAAATSAAVSVGAIPSPSSSSSPKPQHFLMEYLVGSCGLSSAEASRASKALSGLNSTENPDNVVAFLRSHGFDSADLRKLVSFYPVCLSCKVDKTLVPKFGYFRDLGFSDSGIVKLVMRNPFILHLRLDSNLIPKIEAWRNILGPKADLSKFFGTHGRLLGGSIEKRIHPNLVLLRSCGIADHQLSLALMKRPTVLLLKLETLKELVDRVQGLGISQGSGMFIWCLVILHTVSRSRFEAMMQSMKSLGWSESEFLDAFRRAPTFLNISIESIKRKMEFFAKEAGYGPSSLAKHPALVTYSLEKRIVPRMRIMEILKLNKLHNGKYSLVTIVCMTEETFRKKYVLCHMKSVPELREFLSTSCERIAV